MTEYIAIVLISNAKGCENVEVRSTSRWVVGRTLKNLYSMGVIGGRINAIFYSLHFDTYYMGVY